MANGLHSEKKKNGEDEVILFNVVVVLCQEDELDDFARKKYDVLTKNLEENGKNFLYALPSLSGV